MNPPKPLSRGEAFTSPLDTAAAPCPVSLPTVSPQLRPSSMLLCGKPDWVPSQLCVQTPTGLCISIGTSTGTHPREMHETLHTETSASPWPSPAVLPQDDLPAWTSHPLGSGSQTPRPAPSAPVRTAAGPGGLAEPGP